MAISANDPATLGQAAIGIGRCDTLSKVAAKVEAVASRERGSVADRPVAEVNR